ncbi:MAG: hypothetical protein ACOY8P_09540, partial [Thermodesulfobacteriota bacterium]
MDTAKRVLVSAVLVLLVAIWGGCAAASAATPEPEIYYPKLPAGITTIEEAKQDLAILLKEVDVIFYYRSSFKLPGEGVLRELYGKSLLSHSFQKSENCLHSTSCGSGGLKSASKSRRSNKLRWSNRS